MNIYSKTRAKIIISTTLISLGVVAFIWLVIFVTDYIIFKNNMHIIFAITTIEDYNGTYITVERGLGYYVIKNENNVGELYLFNHKIE